MLRSIRLLPASCLELNLLSSGVQGRPSTFFLGIARSTARGRRTFELESALRSHQPSIGFFSAQQKHFATYDSPNLYKSKKGKHGREKEQEDSTEDGFNDGEPRVLKKQSFWIFAGAGWAGTFLTGIWFLNEFKNILAASEKPNVTIEELNDAFFPRSEVEEVGDIWKQFKEKLFTPVPANDAAQIAILSVAPALLQGILGRLRWNRLENRIFDDPVFLRKLTPFRVGLLGTTPAVKTALVTLTAVSAGIWIRRKRMGLDENLTVPKRIENVILTTFIFFPLIPMMIFPSYVLSKRLVFLPGRT
eukprot:TRINITY_DN16629_c0_g1_i1.p1 TRINITY_DN16629_c0_g1~~TRINITY_DN16629_c0_g1_i1.p1  ORF type:complete len:304 (+),score=50.06 TRINITY_DN16629_c0_g1_i1:69-980(+)